MKHAESLKKEIHDLRLRWQNGVVKEASPVFLSGGRTAVLLIHGFTSSPKEFSELAREIHSKGYTVYAPLLPGHGTSPEDLKTVDKNDWIDSVLKAYDYLTDNYPLISVVGFSMGGTLSIILAAKKKIEKIVLVAPLIKIRKRPEAWISPEIKAQTVGYLFKYLKKNSIGNINNPDGLKRHFAYIHYPLSAVRELIALVKNARRVVKNIEAPILVIHSKNDKTADYRGSEWILRNIGSIDKNFIWLKNSNHVLWFDYDREKVISSIVEFLCVRKS